MGVCGCVGLLGHRSNQQRPARKRAQNLRQRLQLSQQQAILLVMFSVQESWPRWRRQPKVWIFSIRVPPEAAPDLKSLVDLYIFHICLLIVRSAVWFCRCKAADQTPEVSEF